MGNIPPRQFSLEVVQEQFKAKKIAQSLDQKMGGTVTTTSAVKLKLLQLSQT
jgi:hypothetical protein